jgi:capsid protein
MFVGGRKLGQRRIVGRGNYDAAQTTADNRRWWANADALSAKTANTSGIRSKLRRRARYEVANNCYAGGINRTIAEEAVGTGPRLQLTGIDRRAATMVEREFHDWCAAIGLADLLITQRKARCTDGESVGIIISNDHLPTPVKTDLRLVEAEHLSNPMRPTDLLTSDLGDGIEFDEYDNPTAYNILRHHPADGMGMQWDRWPAERVIHDYRVDRPGQLRGIPELTPALPLFALLRAYGLATLTAAESIANFAAVAYTDAPGDDGADDWDEFDELELQRNTMTSLPRGWKMGQIKPEQPASTYREFKREIVAEIGRIFSMPFIVAAADSTESNYASGRMDYQVWYRSIDVDRRHIERTTLERLFRAWRDEAILIEGYLPQRLRTTSTNWQHSWMWPGREHVDPLKEANAQDRRLANCTTHLADEYAKQGKDWEQELETIGLIEQRKKELEERYGVKLPITGAQPTYVDQDDDDEKEEKDQAEINAAYMLERDADGRLKGWRRAAS